MQRIATATKAVDLHGVGKHGFKDGNLGLGIQATDFEAAWANGVQEEIVAFIESSGLVPSGATLSQMLLSARRLFGGNIKTVTAAMSPYQITADDAGLLRIDATAGAVVLTMPSAAATKMMPFALRRVDATANAVTINRGGADTLDGVTSAPLVGQGQYVLYRSDGVADFKAAAVSPGTSRFTANGNFTAPAGVTTVYVSGVAGGSGGGAGGGGAAGGVGGGGAGGSAGQSIIRQSYAVTPGQVIAITIGAGGAGGVASGTGGNGGASGSGGNTVVGALVTLAGAAGSGGGTNSVAPAAGGGPGAGYPSGSYGDDASGSPSGSGGPGASSPFGGGGGGARGASGAGVTGIGTAAYGAGGGGGGGIHSAGANNGGNGGVGGPGLVIFEW